MYVLWRCFVVVKKEKLYYSQTEIANELKVSQATISRLLRFKDIKPVKRDGKTKKYTKEQLKHISFLLTDKKERTTENTLNDKLFKELKKEIESLEQDKKDYQDQINQLQEQLKMAQINLNQSQQLQLEQSKKIKELEAPKDNMNEEEIKMKSNAPTTENKSIWSRIFRN